jgi:hypothetical protein
LGAQLTDFCYLKLITRNIMTTALAEKKRPNDRDKARAVINDTFREFSDREAALHKANLTLAEFAGRVSVEYDDRWRWHDWRVRGDESLGFWIYDHIIHDKKDNQMISDAEVVEHAYNRLRAIQERRGQLNSHSMYVRDVEEINLFEPKLPNHAAVRVVKDRIDGLYRYSTSHFVGLGGSSSAPWFGDKEQITETREDAVLKGARYIYESLTESWQAADKPGMYAGNINKIKNFIESIEATIRQPSLFG